MSNKVYRNNVQVNGMQKVLITINHEQEAQQAQKTTVDAVHHIHVLDRSGSMSSDIRNLIRNVKQTIDVMHDNDHVSIVWFSGHQQCRSLLKGGKKDKSIYDLLDSIASTVGLTCFSTPMKEVNDIINEWKSITPNFSITIFTDGEPVVPWSINDEERKIFDEITHMKDQVLAINTIGYGWYYNQDLLKRMAEASMYGTAIHSKNIDEYLAIFNHNFEKIADLISESAEIVAPDNVQVVYLNTTGTKYSKDGKIRMSRLEKRKNQFFLLADSDFVFEINGEKVNTKNVKDAVREETITNFFYAYGYELFATGNRKEAVKVLANSDNSRDKFLIDRMLNVFTYDEVASVLKEFRKAVIKPASRFADGEAKVGYLPREDQFCVMDALYTLTEGNNHYVVSNNYKRIGVAVVDEFNLFQKATGETVVPFETLSYNKEQLNVSILCKITGMVKLNAKEAKEHNLPKEVDSHIYRNHTIIKDGNLNMEEIEVIVDEATLKTFQEKSQEFNVNFINSLVQTEDGRFRLNIQLSNLPVINAAYGNAGNNIESVFDSVEKTKGLEIKQTVLNHYIKQIKENNVYANLEGKYVDYTPEQVEVLKKHGLAKDFTYNGVDNQKQESVDYYEARSIVFDLKGLVSIPKVTEAVEKMADPKKSVKANENIKAMYAYIQDLTARLAGNQLALDDNSVETKEFLQKELGQVKSDLKKERTKVHILKMAKVLTGDWFEGIDVNDDGEQTYTKGNKTLVVKQKRIRIDI